MKRIVVIGLGIFGFNIVRNLHENGLEVLAIDKNRVGPLTLAFSWYASRRSLVYAEETVMVG